MKTYKQTVPFFHEFMGVLAIFSSKDIAISYHIRMVGGCGRSWHCAIGSLEQICTNMFFSSL